MVVVLLFSTEQLIEPLGGIPTLNSVYGMEGVPGILLCPIFSAMMRLNSPSAVILKDSIVYSTNNSVSELRIRVILAFRKAREQTRITARKKRFKVSP